MSEEAFVGLGSNVGDRRAHIAAGFASMEALGRVEEIRISSLYETAPIGYADQPHFINAAARLVTTLSPDKLLKSLQTAEKNCGRQRVLPNGPRTLDLDLLLFANRIIDSAHLQVPHPRMTERFFALAPLLELAPNAVCPHTGRYLANYLENCNGMGVHPAGRLRMVRS